MQRLAILGATGSIGTQTLDVVRNAPDRYSVACLTTNTNVALLAEQVKEFRPEQVVIYNPVAAEQARAAFGDTVQVLQGEAACVSAATAPDVDIVLSALVGFAGLVPTIAAIKAGKKVALANKEPMVVAGELINRLVKEHNATLIPVDSEHSAIFQCLVGESPEAIEQITLTASGGPFRELPAEEFNSITVERALKHPNWDMGQKITIDSATLMNKGLEVIEARWLFDVSPEKIGVVIHPQSIIHSLVGFVDGSVKAQLGLPDMRIPIHYALAYPDRIPGNYHRMNLPQLGNFTFHEPDRKRFPCLGLAYQALERGGTAPAVLNAANEIAVAAFLAREIGFTDIPRFIERALTNAHIVERPNLDDILAADKRTRAAVRSYYGKEAA